MDEFEKHLEESKKLLNSTLTKDSPKEEIDRVKEIEKSLDEMAKDHSTLKKDFDDIKGDYIGLIKKGGTSDGHPQTDVEDTPKLDLTDKKAVEKDLADFLNKQPKQ